MKYLTTIVRLFRSLRGSRSPESHAPVAVRRKNYVSIGEIHAKYYSAIAYPLFFEIVSADPTFDSVAQDKMGKYGKWLLALYQKNQLLVEDLYKAREYLDCFDRNRRQLGDFRDINRVKSLVDLYDLIRDYLGQPELSDTTVQSNLRKIKDTEALRLYEDSDWMIIQPLTEQAAVIYGKGTQWCTAATHGQNYFESYNLRGPLHILISRRDNRKYQLHLSTRTYCDETDRSVMRPIAQTLCLSVNVAKFYLGLGWYDLFLDSTSLWKYKNNRFLKLSDGYYFFNGKGYLVSDIGYDDYTRYMWGNDELYVVENDNRYNIIWESDDRPVFDRWYDGFTLLRCGTLILRDGSDKRIYTIRDGMFLEDFLKQKSRDFRTVCQTFADFRDHDRAEDLTPIDKAIFDLAEDPEDYVEYLRIFGVGALYRSKALYKASIPVVQLVLLVISGIGAVVAAFGFNDGGSAWAKVALCSFVISFAIFFVIQFTARLRRNIVVGGTFLAVSGSLLYILAEYGERVFVLTVVGVLLVSYVAGKAYSAFKSRFSRGEG